MERIIGLLMLVTAWVLLAHGKPGLILSAVGAALAFH